MNAFCGARSTERSPDSTRRMASCVSCIASETGSVSSGDSRGEEIAHGLHMAGQYYPERVWVGFGFQDIYAPLLSSDLFCMPSMNEPGGISQLEAFAAGCLVIARATGGLRDTVFPIVVKGEEVGGNGFLFSDYSAAAFYNAMERAYAFFTSGSDDLIYRARVNAERSVYFWDKPAKRYVEEIYGIKEIIRVIDRPDEGRGTRRADPPVQ